VHIPPAPCTWRDACTVTARYARCDPFERLWRDPVIDKEQRAQLRMAVRDGARLVAHLRAERLLDDGGELQLIGDGLVAALADKVDGAAEAAADCAEKLRERGWLGDDELADQLEARLGTRPTPMLRPLPVDLEELAMVLEGDRLSEGGRIDLRNGEVMPEFAFEYAVEIGKEPDDEDQDPDRWLHVHCEGSRSGYGDMEDFIDTIHDRRLAERLSDAIRGRGAFRRFKDVLSRSPDEFTEWHAFSDERQRGRARFWLAGGRLLRGAETLSSPRR
jgi:hypothetical protein